MLTSLLGALVVGGLLAVSGAVLQGVFRNALADPYILGMVGGAALFSALAVTTGLTALGFLVLPAASLLGSCFALALVAGVAYAVVRCRRRQGADGFIRSSYSTVVLAGFVVTGFTGSLEMLVVSYAEPAAVKTITTWIFGSVNGIAPPSVALGAAVFAVVAVILYAFRRELNVMELGHDEAACLGVNTGRTIRVVLGTVALATSVSVALAGMIGFVGLVMPHFARRLVGPRMQLLLPVSAAFGGVFLALAQFVSRVLPTGGDGRAIGVGVVCAIISAPFMLLLLLSRRNGEGWDV
ncbi:MAG: FecCD family ABC transporter permease [Kiritimatiellia bacterium]